MKSMKISFIITSYSGSNETVLMKIIKMLFCKDNNESVWKDVEIVKKIFHNYIRNDGNDVEAIEHILKVDDNLISRDVMNNIEIVNIFDDHIDYGEEHSSSTLHMVESLQKYYESINYTNYQIIISKEHSSLGCSRNIASRKATGDYIFFIDDDDYYINIECLYNNLTTYNNEKDYDMIVYSVYNNVTVYMDFYMSWSKFIKRSVYNNTFESPETWFEVYPSMTWIYTFCSVKYVLNYVPIMYFVPSDRSQKYDERYMYMSYIRVLQDIYKHKHKLTNFEVYSLIFNNILIIMQNAIQPFSDKFPEQFIGMYNMYNNTYRRMYNEFLPYLYNLEYTPSNIKYIIDGFITMGQINKMIEHENNMKNSKMCNKYTTFMKTYCQFHKLLSPNNLLFIDFMVHTTVECKRIIFVPISQYLSKYKNPNLLREFTILTPSTHHVETHCIGNHDHSIRAFLSSHNLEFSIKNNDFILKHSGYKLL